MFFQKDIFKKWLWWKTIWNSFWF